MKKIYEGKYCEFGLADKPLTKWHAILTLRRDGVSSRMDFTPKEAMEVFWLSAIAGEAMMAVIRNHGSKVAWMNYQDNGNWSFRRAKERGENVTYVKPIWHMHLFGRGDDDPNQPFGESLKLPFPVDDPDFYASYEVCNDEIIKELREGIEKRAQEKPFEEFFSLN